MISPTASSAMSNANGKRKSPGYLFSMSNQKSSVSAPIKRKPSNSRQCNTFDYLICLRVLIFCGHPNVTLRCPIHNRMLSFSGRLRQARNMRFTKVSARQTVVRGLHSRGLLHVNHLPEIRASNDRSPRFPSS